MLGAQALHRSEQEASKIQGQLQQQMERWTAEAVRMKEESALEAQALRAEAQRVLLSAVRRAQAESPRAAQRRAMALAKLAHERQD